MPTERGEQRAAAGYEADPGVRLMLAWREGEERAFDRLVEEYSPQVYAFLTRFLGHRATREDLVQEVFLRVVRARERYEPTARFSTWLYRIAFNLAVNETQRVGGADALSLDQPVRAIAGDASPFLDLQAAKSEEPSAELERDDVIQAVRRAIARLPENQRLALILAKYHDYPYAEIAEVLDSSEKAIKSLVHRARESLRAMLAPFLHQGETS